MEYNLPERERMHPLEGTLQRSLSDRSLGLLWNQRRGFWQLASWDPKDTYVQYRLIGVSGIDSIEDRTHWLWILDCAAIAKQKQEDDRPVEPREPGEWLIEYMYNRSQLTRPDLPEECRADPTKFVEWINKENDYKDDVDSMKDTLDWAREMELDTDFAYRSKKIFIPSGVVRFNPGG